MPKNYEVKFHTNITTVNGGCKVFKRGYEVEEDLDVENVVFNHLSQNDFIQTKYGTTYYRTNTIVSFEINEVKF